MKIVPIPSTAQNAVVGAASVAIGNGAMALNETWQLVSTTAAYFKQGTQQRITCPVKANLVDGETVTAVSHETLGCSISQASASVLTDLIVGRSVGESMKILQAFQEMAQSRGTVEPDEDVLGDGVAFAGVAKYPARVKCALLGWMAFKDAVSRAEGATR